MARQASLRWAANAPFGVGAVELVNSGFVPLGARVLAPFPFERLTKKLELDMEILAERDQGRPKQRTSPKSLLCAEYERGRQLRRPLDFAGGL